MTLVASVQRLAALLSTTMTSEQPRMRIQHRHAGEPAPTCPHGWTQTSLLALVTRSCLHFHRHSILFPAFAHAVP